MSVPRRESTKTLAALGACFALFGLLAPTLVSSQTRGTDASVRSTSAREGRVLVRGGRFRPFYPPPGRSRTSVASFWLDEHAVTNADFLAFVEAHPEWRRSHVTRLFADEGYLSRWEDDTVLGTNAGPNQPVTGVSWFASRAYCEAHGGRLPSEAEWEYAARASESARDGTRDRALEQRILAFYAHPRTNPLPDVRSTYRNVWGAWDMHGLVWEWVEDWNATRAIDDGRGAASESGRFCGDAALDARERRDYASFMRFSFRASLHGDYTVRTLGFRCAADAE